MVTSGPDAPGPSPPHFAPRATKVIFIYLSGGPSHIDLLDPKPQMAKLDGQPVPESLLEGLTDPVIKSTAAVMASPRKFHRYGRSGLDFSDLQTPRKIPCQS
mgnify:CR=1 FL=1